MGSAVMHIPFCLSNPENTEKYHCTIVPFAFLIIRVGMVYYIYIYYYIYYNIYNNIYKSIGVILGAKSIFEMVQWYNGTISILRIF